MDVIHEADSNKEEGEISDEDDFENGVGIKWDNKQLRNRSPSDSSCHKKSYDGYSHHLSPSPPPFRYKINKGEYRSNRSSPLQESRRLNTSSSSHTAHNFDSNSTLSVHATESSCFSRGNYVSRVDQTRDARENDYRDYSRDKQYRYSKSSGTAPQVHSTGSWRQRRGLVGGHLNHGESSDSNENLQCDFDLLLQEHARIQEELAKLQREERGLSDISSDEQEYPSSPGHTDVDGKKLEEASGKCVGKSSAASLATVRPNSVSDISAYVVDKKSNSVTPSSLKKKEVKPVRFKIKPIAQPKATLALPVSELVEDDESVSEKEESDSDREECVPEKGGVAINCPSDGPHATALKNVSEQLSKNSSPVIDAAAAQIDSAVRVSMSAIKIKEKIADVEGAHVAATVAVVSESPLCSTSNSKAECDDDDEAELRALALKSLSTNASQQRAVDASSVATTEPVLNTQPNQKPALRTETEASAQLNTDRPEVVVISGDDEPAESSKVAASRPKLGDRIHSRVNKAMPAPRTDSASLHSAERHARNRVTKRSKAAKRSRSSRKKEKQSHPRKSSSSASQLHKDRLNDGQQRQGQPSEIALTRISTSAPIQDKGVSSAGSQKKSRPLPFAPVKLDKIKLPPRSKGLREAAKRVSRARAASVARQLPKARLDRSALPSSSASLESNKRPANLKQNILEHRERERNEEKKRSENHRQKIAEILEMKDHNEQVDRFLDLMRATRIPTASSLEEFSKSAISADNYEQVEMEIASDDEMAEALKTDNYQTASTLQPQHYYGHGLSLEYELASYMQTPWQPAIYLPGALAPSMLACPPVPPLPAVPPLPLPPLPLPPLPPVEPPPPPPAPEEIPPHHPPAAKIPVVSSTFIEYMSSLVQHLFERRNGGNLTEGEEQQTLPIVSAISQFLKNLREEKCVTEVESNTCHKERNYLSRAEGSSNAEKSRGADNSLGSHRPYSPSDGDDTFLDRFCIQPNKEQSPGGGLLPEICSQLESGHTDFHMAPEPTSSPQTRHFSPHAGTAQTAAAATWSQSSEEKSRERKAQAMPSPIHSPETTSSQINSPCSHNSSPLDPGKLVQKEAGAANVAPSASTVEEEDENELREQLLRSLAIKRRQQVEGKVPDTSSRDSSPASLSTPASPQPVTITRTQPLPVARRVQITRPASFHRPMMLRMELPVHKPVVVPLLETSSDEEEDEEQREPPSAGDTGFSLAIDSFLRAQRDAVTEIQQSSPVRKLSDVRVVEVKTSSPEGSATELQSQLRQQEQSLLETQKRIRVDQENLKRLYGDMTKLQSDQRKLELKREQLRAELLSLERTAALHEKIVLASKQQVKEAKDKVMQGKELYKLAEQQLLNLGCRLLGPDYLPGTCLAIPPSTFQGSSPAAAHLAGSSAASSMQPEENAKPSPRGPISELKRKVHVGDTGFGVSVTFRPAHKKRKISTSAKPLSALNTPEENVHTDPSSGGKESVIQAKARKMVELHKRSVAITQELQRLRMEADKRAQLSVSVNTKGVRHAVISCPIKTLPAAPTTRTPRSVRAKPPQLPPSDLPSLESIKLELVEGAEEAEASHPRRRRSLMDLTQSPKPTLLLRERNDGTVGGGSKAQVADGGKATAENAKMEEASLSSCFVMPSGLQLSNLGKIQKEKVQKILNTLQPGSPDVFSHINYQCLPINGLKVVTPGTGQKKISAEASGPANLAYTSPLLMFRAYRFSAYYRIKENLKITSSSFCHKLNPVRVLCRYDMQGTCNDEHCSWQHCRDYKMTEKEILMDLLSYHPALAGVTKETPVSEYPNILGSYVDNFMSRHKETMPIEHLCVLLSARINDAAGNVRPHTIILHPRPWRLCAVESGTFSLSVTSKFQTSDCMVPSSRASPERDCVLDAEDVRYFSTDSGSGAELQDMEGAVLDTPSDTRLWLRLAYSKLSNPSRPRDERLNQALNVLSRGLESNKNSEELWVHYLMLFHQHPDSTEEFLELCQTALTCAPSYDIWWQVLEASSGFVEKDLVCSRILAFLQIEHDKRQQMLKTEHIEQAQPNNSATIEGLQAPEVNPTDGPKTVGSRQPDAIRSHQVLEIILYKTKLNIQSGRFKTARHFLQKVLGVHKSSESTLQPLLTHSDSCVLWICLVHLTQFQMLPASLFDPANDNPGRIVSKDNLYIQWGSQEELLPHFDTCLRYLAKPVTLDLSQSLEGCTSPQYIMACHSITNLWIRVGRPYDALNVLKGIITAVTYVEDLWLITADLYVSCNNIDNAREVLQMGARHNPFSARLRYHCAILEMKEGAARPELLEAALEQLEHFVLSFYSVDVEEGKTADPNLLFSKLLAVDVDEDKQNVWKIRAVPPLKKEAKEYALKKDLYLWLCFCLLLELQGEEAKVIEVYESALISFTKAADLCQLWKCYVQFLYRLHQNAQTTSASQHARELIEDAMVRSVVTMPTIFPVPFQRRHETGRAQWQDFSYVTSLVEFYMHLLPRDSAASALQTFYDVMPSNISLLIRCVEMAIKDGQMHKARSLCGNAIYDRVANLQLWKLALSLAHEEGTPAEVEKLYLQAVSVMPLSVSLWKDFLLFEVSQDNANAVRSILTRCEALGLNIQGYVATISSSTSKTSAKS